jgi:hypothetical protein
MKQNIEKEDLSFYQQRCENLKSHTSYCIFSKRYLVLKAHCNLVSKRGSGAKSGLSWGQSVKTDQSSLKCTAGILTDIIKN